VPEGVQRGDGAGGGDIGAGNARRNILAIGQRRPAAALLECGIVRLRRREGVGLVLETAYRDGRSLFLRAAPPAAGRD